MSQVHVCPTADIQHNEITETKKKILVIFFIPAFIFESTARLLYLLMHKPRSCKRYFSNSSDRWKELYANSEVFVLDAVLADIAS